MTKNLKTKVREASLRSAILRELLRWDGGQPVVEIAEPLADEICKRIMAALTRAGIDV